MRPLIPALLAVVTATPFAARSASDTPNPTSVTLVGDLQSELGCPGDWQPDCGATGLAAQDGVYRRAFSVPAGSWQYKVALNGSWDENYGAHAVRDGANVALTLAAPATVRFY